MKSFVQRVIAFAKRHPKGCAWGGLVFGVLALVGGVMNVVSPDPTQPHQNPVGGFIVAVAIIVGCSFLLLRWRRQEWAAQQAEIAARADAQHQAYLRGDDFGVFGTRDTPPV
ncbi:MULTISPECIES: hypothetical protein [Actinomycetes]|uniref:hypothetical protein n=1 Tax=Micromonospora sp. NPDC005367 TaxID=3155590 RepID=UPI0033A022F1